MILTIIYRPINLFKRNRYLLNYFFKYTEKEEPEELKKTFTAFKQINKNITYNIIKRKSIEYNQKNENYQEQNLNDEKNSEDKKKSINIDVDLPNIPNINQKQKVINDFDYKSFISNKLDNPNLEEENQSDFSKISQFPILPKSSSKNPDKNYCLSENSNQQSLKELDKLNNKNIQKIELSNLEDLNNDNSNRKLEEIEKKENICQKEMFNFKEIISKSENSYQGTRIIPYYLNCFRSKLKKNIYLSLENGIFQINKKMELIRYLKNLQLIRIIGKFTLLDQERYFFKNYYKDYLDTKSIEMMEKSKKFRNLQKEEEMFKFIEEKSIQDFNHINKQDKMIFNNIFNKDIE